MSSTEKAIMKTKFSFATIEYSKESTASLRGKQSVRTTFKLSERSIQALSILACQLGIKQKSLFDHLIDDVSSLRAVAKEFEEYRQEETRVAKTYVVSRRTLENLEKFSKNFATPRDAIIEFSIERIIPLIAEEKIKHARRKKMHLHMSSLMEMGKQILTDADEYFDGDDPVFNKYLHAMKVLNNSCRDVDQFLVRSQRVEDF